MAAHQAPASLGLSRQEHWSGLPFPSPMHESEKWKGSRSVVPDPQWPHGLQPTRLPRPWDSPGKNTGVGCHFLLQHWHWKALSTTISDGIGIQRKVFWQLFFSYLHLKVILSSYSSSPFLLVLSRSALLFAGVWVCASVYTCVQGWEWWWQSRLKTSRKYWQWFTEAWQYFSLVHLDSFLCLSFSGLISIFSGQICIFLIVEKRKHRW